MKSLEWVNEFYAYMLVWNIFLQVQLFITVGTEYMHTISIVIKGTLKQIG